MNNPCSWCKQASEQIDSLEYQVENSIPISAIEGLIKNKRTWGRLDGRQSSTQMVTVESLKVLIKEVKG